MALLKPSSTSVVWLSQEHLRSRRSVSVCSSFSSSSSSSSSSSRSTPSVKPSTSRQGESYRNAKSAIESGSGLPRALVTSDASVERAAESESVGVPPLQSVNPSDPEGTSLRAGGWRSIGKGKAWETMPTAKRSKAWTRTKNGWVLNKFLPRPGARARRLGLINPQSDSDEEGWETERETRERAEENSLGLKSSTTDEESDEVQTQIKEGERGGKPRPATQDSSFINSNSSSTSTDVNGWNQTGRDATFSSNLNTIVPEEDLMDSTDPDVNLAGIFSTRPTDNLLIPSRKSSAYGSLLKKIIQPKSPGTDRLLINLDLDLYRARESARKGFRKRAEELLLECISNWPDDGRAYVSLGKLLMKQNRISEAREVYNNGCQALGGENAYIWQAWAVLEEKCGNITQARRLFDAATVADSKHAPAWHGWALLEMRQGNPQKARELLNKGLKLAGSNEYIYQTLAEMERKLGRIEEARALYLLSSKANPKSCPVWVSWGLMEAENGDVNAARKLFQKALEVSPKNRYAFLVWAILESEQGNKEKARLLFQRGVDLNPKDPALLQAFALFEYECGYEGIARNLFQEASVADPSHPPVWIAWGLLEWREGNIEEARALYKRAAEIDSKSPKSARAFQLWGALEDKEGNYKAARELFKLAINLNPNDKVAWFSWASMEERTGNYIRAEELRQLYLQQRTEVVELPWELNSLIAPAVRKMKMLFKLQDGLDDLFSKVAIGDVDEEGLDDKVGQKMKSFDIDAFLEKRLPKEFNSIKKANSQWRRDPNGKPN